MGAAIILAEIGPDVSHWEEDSKLASWGRGTGKAEGND